MLCAMRFMISVLRLELSVSEWSCAAVVDGRSPAHRCPSLAWHACGEKGGRSTAALNENTTHT